MFVFVLCLLTLFSAAKVFWTFVTLMSATLRNVWTVNGFLAGKRLMNWSDRTRSEYHCAVRIGCAIVIDNDKITIKLRYHDGNATLHHNVNIVLKLTERGQ